MHPNRPSYTKVKNKYLKFIKSQEVLSEPFRNKIGQLNKTLTISLQKAEAYGDELRTKLSKLNLVVEALRDSKQLEGKMNGASANLWRGLMEESGGDGNRPSPQWLQQLSPGTGDKSSNQSGEGTNTNSISTETATTK